eukprot:UN10049
MPITYLLPCFVPSFRPDNCFFGLCRIFGKFSSVYFKYSAG